MTSPKPRIRANHVPTTIDPARRLYSAAALECVFDLVFPTSETTPEDQESARKFLVEYAPFAQSIGLSRSKIISFINSPDPTIYRASFQK